MTLPSTIGIAMIPPTLVPRTRLLRRLADLPAVTIVSGPAGAGKSLMLADWARHTDRTVISVSLGRPRMPAPQFWALVWSALLQAKGVDTAPPVRRGSRAAPSEMLPAFLAELRQLDRPVVLLDDVDRLEDTTDARLPEFLADVPPGASVVLACRNVPDLPLHRLRLMGELLEIGASDLRFDMSEGAELLEKVSGRRLDADDVTLLLERTEGWAAGLQLAALSLRYEREPSHFLRYLTGSTRLVSEYLLREVLDREEPDIVSFLLETSVLEVLTEQLCSAVTLRDDSAKVLEELRQRHLFVVGLDSNRERYRYHQLFGELLRHLLRSESPQHYRQVNLRAAETFEAIGDLGAASRHYVEAGAEPRVLALLASTVVAQWHAGIAITTDLPLTEVPRSWIEATPLRTYLWAALLQCGLRSREAAHWLHHEQPTGSGAEAAALAPRIETLRLINAAFELEPHEVRKLAAELIVALERDEVPAWPSSVVASHPWVTELDSVLFGMMFDFTARALAYTGEGARARELMRHPLASGAPDDSLPRASAIATVALEDGRLTEAYAEASRTVEMSEGLGVGDTVLTMSAHRVLGIVHLERDQLPEADEQLSWALRLAERSGESLWRTVTELEIARLRTAQDRPEEALELYQRIRWLDAWTPLPAWMQARLNAAEIGFHLARGELETALSLAHTFASQSPPLLTARLRLRCGQPNACRETLRALSRPLGIRGQLERLLLLAGSDLQAGRPRDARHALQRALDLGRSDWYVRIFLDEGDGMIELLGSLATGSPEPYISSLLSRVPDAARPKTVVPPQVILEPLTTKERQVLACLATHLSLGQIAAELYVSLNTVKTHVRNLYRKLGVTTRAQAVATARSYGML